MRSKRQALFTELLKLAEVGSGKVSADSDDD